METPEIETSRIYKIRQVLWLFVVLANHAQMICSANVWGEANAYSMLSLFRAGVVECEGPSLLLCRRVRRVQPVTTQIYVPNISNTTCVCVCRAC